MGKRPNEGRIFKENFPKCFSEILNRPEKILISSKSKKAKKWPNVLISGKLFQNGQIRLNGPF